MLITFICVQYFRKYTLCGRIILYFQCFAFAMQIYCNLLSIQYMKTLLLSSSANVNIVIVDEQLSSSTPPLGLGFFLLGMEGRIPESVGHRQ